MARTAVYSGTFDPPTLGHRDIVTRGAALFDRLVVAVGTHGGKAPMFDLEERMALVRGEAAAIAPTIEVMPLTGLVVDIARRVGASAILRGLRSGTDLDYETQMAGMNRALAAGIDTVFLVADAALQPIASSLVKEVARGGGAVDSFVGAEVAAAIAAKLRERQA